MANLGLIETKLNSLPTTLRALFVDVFRGFLKDLRFGHPADMTPSENFGGHFYEATTASVADTEFTVAHEFGRVPYLAFPVLDLNTVGSRIVPLKVTRVADDKRIYLSSSVTSAPIMLFLEG